MSINNLKSISLILLLFISFVNASSNNSSSCKIWNKYVESHSNKESLPLPDFSFAGYRFSEESIAEPDYPIYNICDFGAVADDHISDREAFEKAISKAQENGCGIIYFPKGRFLLHEKGEPNQPIVIKDSKIVLRGAGADVTEIYMSEPLRSTNPKEKWMSSNLISFTGRGYNREIAKITGNAPKGSFVIEADNSDSIKKGDWICLRLNNNCTDVIAAELHPYTVESDWSNMIYNGVQVYDYHYVTNVSGNKITLKAPLLKEIKKDDNWYIQTFSNISEVGVEDIAFVGNVPKPFVHHKDDLHDGGWKMIEMKNVVNSWIRRCRFTSVTEMATIRSSANVSISNCVINGDRGHNAIHAEGSSRIWMGKLIDVPSQWHSVGIAKHSIGTVIWKTESKGNSSFESHASQPRATLFDDCRGGLMRGYAGGAIQNNPNHLSDLVLWNYNALNSDNKLLDLWPDDTRYFRFLPPVIVGLHGSDINFNNSQLAYSEGNGVKVNPESLFESQLRHRLGYLPKWIEELSLVDANKIQKELNPKTEKIFVSDEKGLLDAVKKVKSGDKIVLNDGVYKNINFKISESGSFNAPIVFEAKNKGRVVFEGKTSIEADGNNISFKGICFSKYNCDTELNEGIISVTGDNCNIENCSFLFTERLGCPIINIKTNYNNRLPKYLNIYRCVFENPDSDTYSICYNHDLEYNIKQAEPLYHNIEKCHFRPSKESDICGAAINLSNIGGTSSKCLITNNLFEGCNSVSPVVMIGSDENVIYNNTFLNTERNLVISDSEKQVILNNYFLFTGKLSDSTPIVISGNNHIFGCNYIYLPKKKFNKNGSALEILVTVNSSANNNFVVKNSFVNSTGNDISFNIYGNGVSGKQLKKQCQNNLFAVNYFFNERQSKLDNVLHDKYDVAKHQKWVDNYYNGRNLGIDKSVKGLDICDNIYLRTDDSKVYIEDAPKTNIEELIKLIPYNRIEGIDIDFSELITYGNILSPMNKSEVGN